LRRAARTVRAREDEEVRDLCGVAIEPSPELDLELRRRAGTGAGAGMTSIRARRPPGALTLVYAS
jgi:hypothetical protein